MHCKGLTYTFEGRVVEISTFCFIFRTKIYLFIFIVEFKKIISGDKIIIQSSSGNNKFTNTKLSGNFLEIAIFKIPSCFKRDRNLNSVQKQFTLHYG